MKIQIFHIEGYCGCVVDPDGAIYVKHPCYTKGDQRPKHRIQQLAHVIRNKDKTS